MRCRLSAAFSRLAQIPSSGCALDLIRITLRRACGGYAGESWIKCCADTVTEVSIEACLDLIVIGILEDERDAQAAPMIDGTVPSSSGTSTRDDTTTVTPAYRMVRALVEDHARIVEHRDRTTPSDGTVPSTHTTSSSTATLIRGPSVLTTLAKLRDSILWMDGSNKNKFRNVIAWIAQRLDAHGDASSFATTHATLVDATLISGMWLQ